MESNRVSPEGLAEFDQFLDIAEHAGIYVHPTGPGQPDWAKGDRFADDALLAATENFWKQFTARYRNRKVIFAYDLLNEPMIQWSSPKLREKWNRWLQQKYSGTNALAKAWNATNEKFAVGSIPVPFAKDCPGCACHPSPVTGRADRSRRSNRPRPKRS